MQVQASTTKPDGARGFPTTTSFPPTPNLSNTPNAHEPRLPPLPAVPAVAACPPGGRRGFRRQAMGAVPALSALQRKNSLQFAPLQRACPSGECAACGERLLCGPTGHTGAAPLDSGWIAVFRIGVCGLPRGQERSGDQDAPALARGQARKRVVTRHASGRPTPALSTPPPPPSSARETPPQSVTAACPWARPGAIASGWESPPH